jgi:pimeloyl-ACP methyl ester carboxylesterase
MRRYLFIHTMRPRHASRRASCAVSVGGETMPYVTSEGAQLHYEVVGHGSTVFMHTGGGGDGQMYRDAGYVAGLDGYQCVLFDQRGHGRSDKPGSVAGYRMELYVADVIALLDTLGVGRAAFWGYSHGVLVGLATATSHPERIAGLIATGALDETDCDSPEEREWADNLARDIRTKGMRSVVDWFEPASPLTSWFKKAMLDTDTEGFAREVEAWKEWHGPGSLWSRLVCPALLLDGELEDGDGYNQRVAGLIPDARSVTFPGLNHASAFERASLSLPYARDFLRGLRWE